MTFDLFEIQSRSTQATIELAVLHERDATCKPRLEDKKTGEKKTKPHRRQDRIKVDAGPRSECQEVLRGHGRGVVGLQRRHGGRRRRSGCGHGDEGGRSAPARGGRGAKQRRRCSGSDDAADGRAERGGNRRRRSRGRCAVVVARNGCCCRATHAVKRACRAPAIRWSPAIITFATARRCWLRCGASSAQIKFARAPRADPAAPWYRL